jgi:hypothetical protein
MRARSALLFVVAVGVGTLVAAGLAVLAILLLLLAALFFVAVRLRFLFVRLVGGISHFPSPFVGCVMLRHPINPPRRLDVPSCRALSSGRGGSAMDAISWRPTGGL